jgi:hypothetical protein
MYRDGEEFNREWHKVQRDGIIHWSVFRAATGLPNGHIRFSITCWLGMMMHSDGEEFHRDMRMMPVGGVVRNSTKRHHTPVRLPRRSYLHNHPHR